MGHPKMKKIEITIPDIPHGHGLSFKKGLADGLLEIEEHGSAYHETHAASYRRGYEVGEALKQEVAGQVKA